MMTRLSCAPSPESPHYDVCIIGSGPAGMTVCAELMGIGARLCVLESGAETKTAFADSLRDIDCDGIVIPPESRERIFGGSASTWSGLCVPMDPIDLVPRPNHFHVGWPISWEELRKYLYDCVRYGFPRMQLFEGEDLFGDSIGERIEWRYCEEKIFVKPDGYPRYGRELAWPFQDSNVDLITEATVTELKTEDAMPGVIRAAICKDPSGREFVIAARMFVLAAGAIENARILLNSKCPSGGELGNEHDQVGRYLMNHPKDTVTAIQLSRPMDNLGKYAVRPFDGGVGFVGIRLKEHLQLECGALNCYVRLLPHYPWTAQPEIQACRTLIRKVKRMVNFDRGPGGDKPDLSEMWRVAGTAFRSFPGLVRLIGIRIASGIRPRTRMVGLWNFVEMEPRPENRVTIGSRRDALGVPIAYVHHSPSKRDLQSLRKLHMTIEKELETLGYAARLVGSESDLAATSWADAYHYLGTTRMGTDPAKSVVNGDLRVHTIENLYVAGGSVFPTSGCANPTMTIVALSIRLAGHLRSILVTA